MADQEALKITMASAEAAAAAKRAEFESGMAADPGNKKPWMDWVKFELEDGGGIEAARIVFKRVLAAFPDLEMHTYWTWFSTERRFGDVDGQRRVMEEWVRRLPRGGCGFGKAAWLEYLKFEIQNGSVERVRAVGEGLVAAFPMHPFAYVDYVRALAALGRHEEAFNVAESGCKDLSGWCRGHDQSLLRFMAKYKRRLQTKRSTRWEDDMQGDDEVQV
ncbi:unnamed protein product [Alopecurus aequalis]